MANVFLSYAREDAAKAALIAHALTEQGWTVWWDRTIPPGRTFDDVIEDALDDAGCVVVLWSKAAIASHWVRAEAAEGMRRGILVPAYLEDVKIPLEFRRIQAANLRSWGGSIDDSKFEQFLQSVSMLMQPTTIGPVGSRVRQQNPEPTFDTFEHTPPLFQAPPAVSPRRHLATWAIAIAIVAAAIVGLAAWRIASSPRADVAESTPKRSEAAPAAPATESSPPVAPAEATPPATERVTPATPIDLNTAAAPPSVVKPEPARPPAQPKIETRVPQNPEVPSLTGLAVDVARDRIARRGLSVGRVSVKPASRSEMDLVIAQDPAAGTRQPPGTPVSLVVGGP
jgi:TIR domain-containing protein/PASTA domain-containing protein